MNGLMGRLGCHRSVHRAGEGREGGEQAGRIVGSAVHLLKGVSVCMCHRGGQGKGGLCVWGEDIYAGVAEISEPSLTSEGAGLLTALR